MNKVIAILSIVVLITLGALFFCIGFFTGTTVPSLLSGKGTSTESMTERKITEDEVEAALKTQSANISDKVLKILSDGAETVTSSISNVMKGPEKTIPALSSDALLKEIIASHGGNDDCSPSKTQSDMSMPLSQDSLSGKKVVFIGYFRDNVALELQKLLNGKGYKTHVEQSKTAHGESFIFCGPFRRNENAERLVNWLKQHEFKEAKIVDVTNSPSAMLIYNVENSDCPQNEEARDIPEIGAEQLPNLQLTGRAAPAASNFAVAPMLRQQMPQVQNMQQPVTQQGMLQPQMQQQAQQQRNPMNQWQYTQQMMPQQPQRQQVPQVQQGMQPQMMPQQLQQPQFSQQQTLSQGAQMQQMNPQQAQAQNQRNFNQRLQAFRQNVLRNAAP